MRRVVAAYLIAVFVIGAFVALVMTRETETEKKEAEAARQEAEARPTPLPSQITPAEEIAARVEEIRGARFNGKSPAVEVVPQAEVEKRLAALDQEAAKAKGPQAKDASELASATTLLLAQTGALPKGALSKPLTRYGGKGTLGAYVPAERTVLVSRELAEDEPEVAELLVARELSRAIDVGPAEEAPRVPALFRDDEAARIALGEGAASAVEAEYAEKHLGREPSGTSDVQLAREARDDPAAPPLLQTLAAFPYDAGTAFVAGVLEDGGWDGVDEVLGDPPATTAELLHPGAQTEAEPDFNVKLALGRQWRPFASAQVGELDTIALLRDGLGEDAAARAARGWRSGAMQVWTLGKQAQKSGGCPPPCRKSAASIVVWRWADEAAALRFQRAMRRAIEEGTVAEPEGGRGWTIDDGGAALVRAGRFTALVFAPDAPLAGQVATAALEG